MGKMHVALAPDRMKTPVLYERALSLVAACRFAQGRSPTERERLLDELRDVILELRLRGEQLRLC